VAPIRSRERSTSGPLRAREELDEVGSDHSACAKRCLMVHPLRAADALQLGAALVACGDDPHGFEFVCVDERLNEAARREGFTVRP